MKVALIIPALDEEGSIARVVEAVPRGLAHVIVVDNGSTDGTARVAQSAGAQVVRERRRGYGSACAAGVAAAGDDFDVLAFVDGDGSGDPGELPLLLDALEAGADLVLGSRVLGKAARNAVPPHQRLGNVLTMTLVRALYGVRITDPSPFRAIRQPVLASLNMREMTYGWPMEMIVKCARRRYRIAEVPASTHRRIAGKSKVSGTVRGTMLAAYYLIGTTIRYAWRE